MTTVDNSSVVAGFAPKADDGDTFIYTEMLDRSKEKPDGGEYGFKLLKSFYHRSQEEFWRQWPAIRAACDAAGVRACTRLSPRSFRRAGQEHARLVLEAALEGRWQRMRSLYRTACGTIAPNEKLWLWDIDTLDGRTERFATWLRTMWDARGQLVYVATLPSRKGVHHITRPFDLRLATAFMQDELGIAGGLVPNGDVISLHKDNPTNLYIPDGAG